MEDSGWREGVNVDNKGRGGGGTVPVGNGDRGVWTWRGKRETGILQKQVVEWCSGTELFVSSPLPAAFI